MGLLINEINELRLMLKQFEGGKLSAEDLTSKLKIYDQVEKRTRNVITIWATGLRHGIKGLDKQLAKQIVGNEKIDEMPQTYDRTIDRGKD